MKLHSDIHVWMPGRSCVWVVLFLGLVSSPQALHGQYRKLSITASAGTNQLNLDAVDQKNQQDADGWGKQGYPLGTLASVKQSPVYSIAVGYRYDRDFAISLTGSYWSKTVSASYSDPDTFLKIDRGVGSTDFVFGISYYPSARPLFLEWYIQTNVGIKMARATSKAFGTLNQKQGPVLVPVPFVDTDALFTKSKLAVGALLGADIPLSGGFFLNAEGGYRFAQFGTMDGNVTQMGQTSFQTTSIEFDYSGFQVNVGLKYQF
jgi:hypothetical protein